MSQIIPLPLLLVFGKFPTRLRVQSIRLFQTSEIEIFFSFFSIERQGVGIPHEWPNLDLSLLVEEGVVTESDFVNQLKSMKSTDAHKAIIKARDQKFTVRKFDVNI